MDNPIYALKFYVNGFFLFEFWLYRKMRNTQNLNGILNQQTTKSADNPM